MMRLALMAGLVALLAGQPASWRLAEPGRRLAELAVDTEQGRIAVRVTSADEPDCLAVISGQRPGPRYGSGQALGRPLWLPGGSLAAAAADGLWIWAGATVTHWPLPLAPGAAAAASADGSRVAVALVGQGTALLDPRTGLVTGRLATTAALTAVALDHDAGQAVTLEALPEGSGSRLTCWRADTGARLAVRELPPTRWLALAGSLVVSGDAAGIRLWNVALEPLGQAALEDVTTAAVSVDRSYLAAACGARVCWLGLPRLEPLAVSTLDGTVSDLALVGEDLAVAAGEVVRLLPLPAGVGTR